MKLSVRMKRIYSCSGEIFIWEININRADVRSDWVETRRPIMKSESQVRNVSGSSKKTKHPGPGLFQTGALMWTVTSILQLAL